MNIRVEWYDPGCFRFEWTNAPADADAEFDETDNRPVGSCSPHGCRSDDDLEIAGSM